MRGPRSKTCRRNGIFSETLTFKTTLTVGAQPTLRLSAVVGADKNSRKNVRVFRAVDELKDLRDAPCGRRATAAGPNLVYPITGSTGMAEVVRTYIELEAMTDLAPNPNSGEMVTFSDDLEFTTTLEAGAALDLDLKTPVGSLRLSRATVTGYASRKDIHSVKVVLARDRKHRDVDLPDRDRQRMAGRKGRSIGRRSRTCAARACRRSRRKREKPVATGSLSSWKNSAASPTTEPSRNACWA